MRYRLTKPTIALALLLLFATSLSAQFWKRKPFTEWSPRECDRLLSNSPWARERVLRRVFIQPLQERAAVDGRDANPSITYTVQMLSAKPVREAMVRQAQLDRRFARLSEEERETLEERHRNLLARDFADVIVIRVLFRTDAPALDRELARQWQTILPESLKLDVYLIGPESRVPPLQVIVSGGAGGEIHLIFPRLHDGKPIVTSSDRSFALEFQHPSVGVFGSERVFVEFRVRDMVLDGELLL